MVAQRFRKIPLTVETIQLVDEESANDIIEWIGDPEITRVVRDDHGALIGIEILTLEGEMLAGLTDYVIKGIEGEFYPCKAPIFEDSYLPAGPEVVNKELTIEWPRLVDGDPITKEMLKKAWSEFMTPLQEAGRGGETNVKVLLSIFRHVYGGMQN